MSTGVEWLLVATNAAFILPAIKAAMLHRYTRAVLYFFMIFASSFHHACIGGINCVTPADIARKTDFFFAQLLIPVTSLYLIEFPLKYAWLERWLIWGFMAALYFVEVFTNEPMLVQTIVVGVSVFLLIGYWILHGSYEARQYQKLHGRRPENPCKGCRFPNYSWYSLSLGIWLSMLAMGLFGTQGSWPGGYDWIHSLWHVLAALGQYWILSSRPQGEANAALDARIKEY